MTEPLDNVVQEAEASETPELSLKHKGVWTPEQAREAGRRGAEAKRIARLQAKQKEQIEAGQPPTPTHLDVLERRLKNPVLSDAATTIRLRIEGKWALRWVNTTIQGRWDRATGLQGWEPVKYGELKDDRQILNLQVTPDGYVARGDRSQEILMRMPQAFFDQIQRRKQELNKQALAPKTIRRDTQARAVQAGRDDVAEQGEIIETLIETKERVELDPTETERLTEAEQA